MRFLTFISLIIIFFTIYCPCEISAKTESDKIKLDNIKNKIIQKEKKLKEYKKKEGEVIERLNRLEQQLIKENIKVKEINRKISEIKRDIKNSRETINKLNREINKLGAVLEKRLVALYKYHRRSGLRILLSSKTYNDFIRQDKLLKEIVSEDYAIIKKSLNKIEDRIKQEEKLRKQKISLEKKKESYYRNTSKIKSTKKDKLTLLKDTRKKKELQISAINELKKYAKKLQDFIDKLPSEQTDFKQLARKFSSMKGKLSFPVKGKIISKFGRTEHPDLHTFTFQKGIEIKAPSGMEIKSIYKGKVIYADWFKGYGNMTIINHGDHYYSLYAHAEKLLKQVGDIVKKNETVALVGDTNALNGSCLYFEIRHRGKPQDPLGWLKKSGNK
jgi:septal ring factor EnvC (AmiA/AmiB activator)